MIRPVRPDGTIETGGVFKPVLRGRVVDRLASAARQRVVLLIAPAGYGKSVALGQYLDTVSEPCVRFDVLADHAALLGFLRGLSDALAPVAPDARRTLPGAYEKNIGSPSPGADLALWMHSHLKSFRGVIAIDDLHVAQEDREVTRFLASLIERTKGRVQWVIASRATTGLPIGTWLAYGDSDLAIDEHDLKFSFEEAREAARGFRLAVRDDELYELLNVTDGWATAISFALRSSTRSVDLRNISSMTREMIYHYLAEQVYGSLSEDERTFIESCALLPELDVDLLAAAGFDRAAAVLQDLRARVAFIAEREPGRYRLHDLFREFATHQLELRGSTAAAERRAHLAGIMLSAGRDIDALRLYVEARSAEQVAELLRLHGMRLIAHGYVDLVSEAIEVCGQPAGQDPLLVALRGLVATSRGNVAEGERLLQRAIGELQEPHHAADAVIRLAVLRINRNADAEQLLMPLALESDSATLRAEAKALLATALVRSGDKARASAIASEVEEALVSLDDDEALARVLQRLGLVHSETEKPESAVRCLQSCLDIAAPRGLWSLCARAYITLSNVALFAQGAPVVALWNAQQAAQAATRAGDQQDLQSALLAILSLETRRGNAERAQAVERQLGELSLGDSYRAHYIASSQAHRSAWSGRFDEAQRLFGSILNRQSYAPDRFVVHALYALTLALDGENKRSIAGIEVAHELLRQSDIRSGFGATLAECARLFLSAAEIVNGRFTSAARLLRASRTRHDSFLECMRLLVDEMIRAGKNSSYAIDDFDTHLDAIRNYGWGGYGRYLELVRDRIEASHAQLEEGPVVLTPSELKVLRALAAGMSPKEIAADMGRSPLTVQTHIQNLIQKLSSHGRSEAIAAAKRLGLLGGGNAST